MRLVSLLLVALIPGWISGALAQAPQEPTAQVQLEPPGPDQGYYTSLGLNFGVFHVIDDNDPLPNLNGQTLAFRLGQSVNSWMSLGILLEAGGMTGEAEREGSIFLFGIDWGLRLYRPLFLQLSAAIGVNQVSEPVDSDNDAAAFGAVGTIALGYAFHPFYDEGETGSWELSPIVQFKTLQPFGEDAVFFGGLGVEIRYWAGLPKNQLDLDLEDAFSSAN